MVAFFVGQMLCRVHTGTRTPTANAFACRAFSAFCLTVEVSSSIEEAVFSSELAAPCAKTGPDF